MTNDSIRTQDPTIQSVDYENNAVTFKTPNGDRISLDEGTIIEGVGEHYFEGTVEQVYETDDRNSLTGGHWVTFTDVTLGDEQVDEHTLPLGEVAAQIDENGLSIY